MIQIRRINQSDPLWSQAQDLSQRVLGEPESKNDAAALFVATKDFPTGERVIGCIAIHQTAQPASGQLGTFAIDPQVQGQNLARRLLAQAETEAFSTLGLKLLFCDASPQLQPVLSQMGWTQDTALSPRQDRIRMQVDAEQPDPTDSGPALSDGE